MGDEIKEIIIKLGKDFVGINVCMMSYSASGIFKLGKSKKSVTQEVKYFDDKCPLKALKKLEEALIGYKINNKKLYD